MRPRNAIRSEVADGTVVLVAMAVTIGRFLDLHHRLAPRAAPDLALLQQAHPAIPPAMGWWLWFDQGWYERSAVAWAHGITAPGMHWYLPGYPLLGALFARATPADPFLWPDLLCLLATLACFARLGRHVLDAGRWSVLLGCAVFLGVTGWDLPMSEWVTPWTTTPETACLMGALLAAAGLPCARRPALRAGVAGLVAGAVTGIRGGQGAVLLGFMAAATWLLVPPARRGPAALALMAGSAVSVAVSVAAYAAVWGLHVSPYLQQQQQIGFDLRLLPSRWISMMIDPGPLFPPGEGLAHAFPWIATGFAGMAASLLVPGQAGRVVQALVAAATLAELALFLCYRNLHPIMLWRLELHHYFKGVVLIFGLYGMRLAVLLVRGVGERGLGGRGVGRRGRAPLLAAAAGMVAAVLAFSWHLALEPVRPLHWSADGGVDVPDGLQPMDTVVLIPGRGAGFLPVVDGAGSIADGRVVRTALDAVTYDPGTGLRLLPLRSLPAADTVFHFDAATRLDQRQTPELERQVIRWGLPGSWLHLHLRAG